MLFEFLTGAGVKLLSNIIQNIFSNSAEERRNRELQDEKVAQAHVELAKIHQKDPIVKVERLIVFWMLCGTFCYMSYAHFTEVDTHSVVLVDRQIGWISRLFTQAKQGAVQVSGATFIFELWVNLIVLILGSYSVPPRKQ